MSDLISRSKVIAVLEKLEEHSLTGKMDISNAIYLLENQPTSYDIDKVIDELEKVKTINIDVGFGTIYKTIRKDTVIEIINQFGISNDVCEWRLCDEEANVYDTSCRNSHILIEGTPKENNYEYCPYCGKKIKVVE